MKKINIAQIGYGYWGKKLYRYLSADKKLFLKYVCDFSLQNNGKFINNLNIILEDKNIKAVVIATPIDTHYELVKKVLLSGKSVLSEKPLVLKLKEALELEKIADKKKLLLLTEFTYTFSKAVEKAKKIIDSGAIGKIESMELSLKYAGRFLKQNVYWLLAPHLLSILDVFVPLESLNFKKIDFIKHENRTETGLILFRNKEVSGKITVSLNSPDKEMRVIIYGQKGTLVYSSMAEPALKFTCYKKTESVPGDKLITKEKSFFINEKNNLKLAVDYFYKALNKQVKSNIDRAILITKILENKK
jgi:predicted dehydrogenase